jgi:hypothetical protein
MSRKSIKKIKHYEFKKMSHEAELMMLITQYKETPKSYRNQLHRLKMQIDKIKKRIESYDNLIAEVKEAV